jgi:hypothetical protein
MFKLEKTIAGLQARMTITHIEHADLCIIHLILKRKYSLKTRPNFDVIMTVNGNTQTMASFETPEIQVGKTEHQSRTLPFTKDMLGAKWDLQAKRHTTATQGSAAKKPSGKAPPKKSLGA